MPNTENHAEQEARAQVQSIARMVAALDVDYDRLQELRDLAADESMPIVFDTGSPLTQLEFEELAELEEAAGDCTSEDDAIEAIQNDPLSIDVRSGWASTKEEFEPEEFRILLCTGGPHVELQGELDRGAPSRIRVIYKDWGTSGEYFPDSAEREALETYCAQFYFGE